MTLFYKNKEDVVESEEDPSTVNVNEVCQHCGNESGYTLIGKVGEAEEELPTEDAESADEEGEDIAAEEPAEDGAEDAGDGDAAAEVGQGNDGSTEFDGSIVLGILNSMTGFVTGNTNGGGGSRVINAV